MWQVIIKTQVHWRHCIKLPSGQEYKVYFKCKWILLLDLGLLIFHIYASIPNSEKKSLIWNTFGPKDKGDSACRWETVCRLASIHRHTLSSEDLAHSSLCTKDEKGLLVIILSSLSLEHLGVGHVCKKLNTHARNYGSPRPVDTWFYHPVVSLGNCKHIFHQFLNIF
jgi:hypothetical protein